MFAWFIRLFGLAESGEVFTGNVHEKPHEPVVEALPVQPDIAEVSHSLEPEGAGFLLNLLNPDEQQVDLQSLSSHDREFVAANLRSLVRKEFEIPLLPGAIIRIQQILANPDARMEELAEIFKKDPTLTAELLRLANSSYLSYIYPTLDLHQAIIRVGFNQLHGLVLMFSLRSRILHVKKYEREVTWVSDLALAMAKMCQLLAPELKMPPEEAFTLGLMHHIEHLVVLGVASKYTVTNRGAAISRSAVTESIRRVGTQLHDLIAYSWGISSFVKYYETATGDIPESMAVSDVPKRLDQLQRILIETMAGRHPIIEIEGFDSVKLKAHLDAVVPSPSFAV
jgi:hypothetical protein